jgi:hypothetical protein
LWNIYDGFYNWPRQNEIDRETGHDQVSHSDMDLLFNRVLGLALPPAGILLVIWMLRKSRGEFRLSGQTLHVPGHPPIPLECVDSLDKGQWERKGVAVVTYKLPDARTGKFKLDDFVYDRDGIDEIYRRIESSFQDPAASPQPSRVPAPELDAGGDDQGP